MFDDEFMNDMLLNPDLYGLEEDDEEGRKKREDEEDEDEETGDNEE